MKRIDLIIDALEEYEINLEIRLKLFEKALAAARELKALKPVGIVYDYFGTTISPYNDGLFNRLEKYPDINLQKLYALDEVTK